MAKVISSSMSGGGVFCDRLNLSSLHFGKIYVKIMVCGKLEVSKAVVV